MKIFARPLRALGYCLLGILLLIIAMCAWIFSTHIGTKTLATKILPMANIQATGVTGSLLDGLRIEHLSIPTAAADIDIQSLYLDVQWQRLWDKTVFVRALEVENIQVALHDTPPEPQEQQSGTIPVLPIDVVVDHVSLGKLDINSADGQPLGVGVRQLKIDQLQWIAHQAGLDLKKVIIEHDLASTQLSGKVNLKDITQKALPLDLTLQAQISSLKENSPVCVSTAMQQALEQDDKACQINAQLQLTGSLQDLGMNIVGKGAGFDLEGQGKLDLSTTIPLQQLTAQVKVEKGVSAEIKATTQASAAQDQQLIADVKLDDIDLASIAPASRVGAVVQINALASGLDKWKSAKVHFQLAESSRWNGSPLQGGGDVGLDFEEALRITSDWQVNTSNNQIQAKGSFGRKEDVLSLEVKLPQLAKVYPNAGQSLSLLATLAGDLQEHTLTLKGDYVKTPQGKTLGEAPVDVELLLKGGLEAVAQSSRWKGVVENLHINHAGYELLNQQGVDINVSSGDTLQWSVGQAVLVLKQPTGETTEFVHQSSQQQDQQIQSQGNIKALHIQKSIFDVDWQVTNQPTWNVAVNMLRTNEVDKVQSNPLANIQRLALTLTPVEQKENYYKLLAKGEGDQTQINGDVSLNLQNPLVVDNALVDLSLSDGTLLKADIAIKDKNNGLTQTGAAHQTESQSASSNPTGNPIASTPIPPAEPIVQLNLNMKNLALDKWSLGALPANNLNGELRADVLLSNDNMPKYAEIAANFLDNSVWNKQPLKGEMHWVITQLAQPKSAFLLDAYRIEKADTNLSIGHNRIFTEGAFGRTGDGLKMDIQLPLLSELDPSLAGGVAVKGKLEDSIAQHQVDLSLAYASKGMLKDNNPNAMKAHVIVQGGWGEQSTELSSSTGDSRPPIRKEGWAGTIQTLTANYQRYGIQQLASLPVKVIPSGEKGLPEWDVGSSKLQVLTQGKQILEIHQMGSTGKRGTWTTKGAIHQLVINKRLLHEVRKLLGQENDEKSQQIVVKGRSNAAVSDLTLDVDWDIGFDKALKGQASIVRRAGDLALPLNKPLPMDLKNLSLKMGFKPQEGTHSTLNAQLLFDTANKGSAQIDVSSDFNGLEPNLKGGTKLKAVGGIKDISWASVFANDLLSLGGAVTFDAQLSSTPSGQWHSSGFVTGENLRIVEVENGVRLLNGTLKASFNDMKARIETLHFPAVMRVTPKEWRTRQWIEENPPAQQGSLNITGDWDLEKAKGSIRTVLDHYPIVQRADRFAMMSGEIVMEAQMPKINLTGKVTADAGWASIDIKDTVPTVDGDVVVLKPGQKTIQPQGNASEDLNMNLTVDLGPRFYLVGMGLNSGLVGAITLVQDKGRLTAEGQFRTRGGAIEAYGQRLQIAKGEIAFGGNITNPSLNIEAIRRGLEVEAGLRVIGTAKRPKIMLVSYPDVSDVEKLSWLIMGRGPDSSSADLALLFSVGSSLITDADSEPFYRKVGIDEIGMKAGSVGESDNILPKRTVADSSAYRGYEEASQLFYATKKFGDAWRVSAEQALSGSGTVIRGSYKLMKHLTVDAKVGTVNGIELLYKRVFKD